MTTYTFFKIISEKELEELTFHEYTIAYHDASNNLLKLAVPDYHKTFSENNNIDEAMQSNNVVFLKNIHYSELENDELYWMIVSTDGVIQKAYNNYSHDKDFFNLLVNDGHILSKRLKR